MENFKERKNIIFDYDGTLHNSFEIYSIAFKEAYKYLVKSNLAKEKVWKNNEISKWLGYSSRDMWNAFMPNLSDEEKAKCSSIIGESMINQVNDNKVKLYDGALEVLNYLNSKGYNLIFLSNCKIEYMNKHKKLFKLDNYFNAFYCTEQFGFIPKYEIFKVIKKKYTGEYIIIGDRIVDIEIATMHDEVSIGCSYGYGELWELYEASTLIDDIKELMLLL